MKIILFGDVMLGENLFHLKRGIRTKFKGAYKKLIPDIIKNFIFEEADVILMNLEYSLIDPTIKKIFSTKELVYRGDIESIDFFNLKRLTILNIANNHFSQHGKEASIFTKDIFKKNGKFIIGDSFDPLVIKNNGTNLNIWGYSLIPDPYFCEQYNLTSLNEITSDIKFPQKGKNDFWIVSLHWGDEYISQPSEIQVQIAHQLIDSGVDLIYGHHPHVIQSVEIYKEKIIIYSHGNFIFDQNFCLETRKGLVSLVDTDNIIASKFFITEQNDFMISKIENIELTELNLKLFNNYDFELIKSRTKFRKNMKREYLRNIFKTDIFVLIELIKKKLKLM